MWPLCGTLVEEFLASQQAPEKTTLAGTDLPLDFARWIIEREWVHALEDLVERRLMLLYHEELSVDCLGQLANLLVDCGRMKSTEREDRIAAAITGLQKMYGKRIVNAGCCSQTKSADLQRST
jgi:glycerol-3-phosphate dehydrogenase